MSEVNEKDLELQEKSLQDLFSDSQESLEEAQARKAKEEVSFVKAKYFVMDSLGSYNIRILPLPPKSDRRGYEYPVRQMLLKINNPDQEAKKKQMYIKVCKATDAGYSVDLIDTYKKLALDAVKDDEDLVKKIKGGTFGGGLAYGYNHAMYVINLDKEADGMMIWEASNGQFKDLEDQKESVWKKMITKSKNAKFPCPISSWNKGFPIEITKKKENNKTEYKFIVDVVSDSYELSEKQLKDLMSAPTLPEIIYRYTKYHMDATIEFLKQYDETSDLNIMEHEDMLNAIEILKGELPADDTSSFSFKSGDDDKSDEANDEDITFDKLAAIYDDLQDKKLGDKTEEGQNLRSLISEYIKSKNLSIAVKRGKSNSDLLDEIEAELDTLGGEPTSKKATTTSVKNKKEVEETPSSGVSDDAPEEKKEETEETTADPAPTEDVAPRRRRR